MLVAVVVVLGAAAGPEERELADRAIVALTARGVEAELAESTPTLDLRARLAEIDDAFVAMDVSHAAALATHLVRDVEGPAGAELTSEDLGAVFARRALVARLGSDPDGERAATGRICASGELPPLPEADYPSWLRDAAVRACAHRAELPTAPLTVESGAEDSVVRIDGAPRGVAPITTSVPPGRHIVHVTAPGARPFGTALQVREAGGAVRAPGDADPTSGLEQAARAGYSHRVLVSRDEDGLLHIRVEASTRIGAPPALDLEREDPALDSDAIDALLAVIAPPPPARRPPSSRRVATTEEGGGPPTWVWFAVGAVVVAAGGIGIALASSGDDAWRGYVDTGMP